MASSFTRKKLEPILFHLFFLLLLATGCLAGILVFNHVMNDRLNALTLLQERHRTICNVSLVINKNVMRMQVGFQSILLASSHGELHAAGEQIAETMETVRRAAVFLDEGGVFVETFKVNFDSMDKVMHTFRLESGQPRLGVASMELRTSVSLIEGMLTDYYNLALVRLADEQRGDSSSQLILMHKRLSPFFDRFSEHANRFYVQSMKDLVLNQQGLEEQRNFHSRTLVFASCTAICVLLLAGAMVIRSAWQVLVKRRQAEEVLRAHNRFQEMVAAIAADFVAADSANIDGKINETLRQTGQFFSVDRSDIFLFSPEQTRVCNTHEWRRQGVTGKMDLFRDFPVSDAPWYRKRILEERSVIHIPDVAAMPEDAGNEQAILQSLGIRSALSVPIYTEKKIYGFIGFDALGECRRWSETEIQGLSVVAQILANAFTGIDVEQELRQSNLLLEAATGQSQELADKAEAANRAKSIFLANMSHEIRTPMNGIIGMAHLARRAETDAERQRFLQSVQQSAESLLGLVNDILDFSKIEAGQLRLHSVPFDLRRVLEGIVSTMNVSAVEKGLALRVRVQDDLPAIFVGDDLRLRQILLNLVGNAIKFTRHGSVLISVSGNDSMEGGDLHFVVTDTGIGIPPEKCTVIFKSFEQADSSHARRFGGTGLGLAICSQLVGLMGGRIWVESTEDIGSAFHFTVMLRQGTEAAPADPPAGESSPVQDTGGLRVLVVDDNEVNRDVACMTLEQEHHVTTASNGMEALQLLAAEEFDVILMDVQMPEMDGLEATGIIRSLEQGLPLSQLLPSGLIADLSLKLQAGHMQIMAMTAHAMGEDREVCLGAGMDGYITKPFQPAELARLLRSMATGVARREDFFPPAADVPPVPVDVSTLSPRMAQVVTHLQTANNLTAEQLDHILDAARKSIATTLDKARDAAARADYPALASAAHTLKGTLLQCGLYDLAQMVGEIHYDVKNHGGLSCDSILAQFTLILAGVFTDEDEGDGGSLPVEDRL